MNKLSIEEFYILVEEAINKDIKECENSNNIYLKIIKMCLVNLEILKENFVHEAILAKHGFYKIMKYLGWDGDTDKMNKIWEKQFNDSV